MIGVRDHLSVMVKLIVADYPQLVAPSYAVSTRVGTRGSCFKKWSADWIAQIAAVDNISLLLGCTGVNDIALQRANSNNSCLAELRRAVSESR